MTAGPAGLPPRLGLAVVALAISSAAILVRWSAAPPLAVGAWRLALASPLFWCAAVVARAPLTAGWTPGRFAAALVAAAFLAAHFGLWIASLSRTTIASSVLLLSTQPIFVAVLGRLFLGERGTRRAALGIAFALLGSLGIAAGWPSGAGVPGAAEPGAWRGDLLALGGALAIAVYYLFARRLRASVDLLPLMGLVTPVAAALLAAAAIVAGEPLAGYSSARTGASCSSRSVPRPSATPSSTGRSAT